MLCGFSQTKSITFYQYSMLKKTKRYPKKETINNAFKMQQKV